MKRPLNPTSRRKRPCRMPRIAAAILLTALTAIAAPKARADEGMWLPSLIGERIDDMRAKGFRLTAEDIYSVNKASMKDAVVLFNGGCTGELISPEGLLVTNHHCGYGAIQGHSTVEHDYLTHGFWARDRSEELPNEGLWVRRLVRMEEVTDRLAAGETAEKICEEAAEKGRYRTAIEQMYYGNQQFLFVYEQFDDVRLVGAPPSSIGKFGGDTDNWMWPRHTGDFSLFRIYADRENRPAKFSRENVPYRPARYFPVSTKGIREGDFTMIYGFPGNTQQYVTADAVAYVVERSDPMKIDLRTRRLEIISAAQEADAATRIRYAAKHASIANAWKKWQGELLGLQRLGTVAQKKAYEAAFARWAADRPEYAYLLDSLRAAYRSATEGYYLQELCNESVKGIELATLAAALKQYAAKPSEALAERIAKLYRDYDPAIDRRVAVEMLRGLEQYYPRPLPEAYTAETTRCKGVEGYAARLFDASAIVRFDAVEPLLRDTAALRAALQREPVLHLVGIFDRGRIPRNLSNLPVVERWYPPLHEGAARIRPRTPLLPRRQPHAARGLRAGGGLLVCRCRLPPSADDARRHHRQGRPDGLRLRHPPAAARLPRREGLRTLEHPDGRRRRDRPRLLPGDEPHHGRQLRFAGRQRRRRTGGHQFRPHVAFDDERPAIRPRDLPQYRRRHPLRALHDRPHRRSGILVEGDGAALTRGGQCRKRAELSR